MKKSADLKIPARLGGGAPEDSPSIEGSLKAIYGSWQEGESFFFGNVATGRLPVHQWLVPHACTLEQH